MSIATPPIPAAHPRPKRWSGEEFDDASRSGVFAGQRLELINGELLEMPPMNDPHAQGIQLANFAVVQVFPMSTHTVRIQCPMRLGESRPLPDLVLVPGTARQVTEHPTTALLIIEVSDTTLEYDRGEKAALYAAHGLPDYWIINLNGRCVEVHRKPIGSDTGDPRYGEVRVYAASETLSPLAAPESILRVAELLP